MKQIISLLSILLIFCILHPKVISAQQDYKEPKILISNITANSITISWFTNELIDQAILYGKAEPLTTWAADDRGAGVDRNTHHITLKNLEPNTEYKFRLGGEGKTYRQRTATKLTGLPPLEERFFGTVISQDKTFPNEALVYMHMSGAEILSTYMEPNGSWQIKTVFTRTESLNAYYRVDSSKTVNLFARAGFEGEDAKKLFMAGRAYPITMDLEEVQIPFFRIKLPGLPDYFPDTVTPTPTPTPTPVPAGTQAVSENIFSVIWARLSAIF